MLKRHLTKGFDLRWQFVIVAAIAVLIGLSWMGRKEDFPQYWSAFRLALDGLNPYDPVEMLRIQSGQLGRTSPVMMWNPPWLLVFLAPVLVVPFDTSLGSFLVLSVVLAAISTLLVFRSLQGRGGLILVLCLAVLLSFQPLRSSYSFGQIGALLLFSAALFIYGVFRDRPVLIALGLVLSTVKPHLFYLVYFIFVYVSLRERRWSWLIWPAGLFLGVLCLTELVFPGVLRAWISTFEYRDLKIVPHPQQWIGCTVTGVLRTLLTGDLAGFGKVVMILVPGLTAVFTLVWLIRVRWRVDLGELFVFLLLLSVVTAPFGWFFDQSVLLIPALWILSRALEQNRYWIVAVLFLMQLVSYIQVKYFAQFQHEMFWFGPTILILWLMSRRPAREP